MASAGFEPTCRGRMRAAGPQAPPARSAAHPRRAEWGGRESNPQSRRRRVYNPLGSPMPVASPRSRPPGRIRTCASWGRSPVLSSSELQGDVVVDGRPGIRTRLSSPVRAGCPLQSRPASLGGGTGGRRRATVSGWLDSWSWFGRARHRVPRCQAREADEHADGRDRTATGQSPHGSEPCMSSEFHHVRVVVWAGIEPASPGLQPGACAVSATTPERQHGESVGRIRTVVEQRCRLPPRLSVTTPRIRSGSGGGSRTQASFPGSEPGVLPIRRPRSVWSC